MIKKYFSDRILFRLLQLSAASVFIGRAWQHLYWDAPFRALLWDESLMKPLIAALGWSWKQYASNSEVDAFIQSMIKGVGVLYLIAAIAAYSLKRYPRISRFLLLAGGANLIFLAFLSCKSHFYYAAQFFEHSLQFSAPFLLLAYWRQRTFDSKWILAVKIAIALTFISHGLFAVGYYPRPAYFVEMTMRLLPLDQQQAIQFLKIAGILDFIVALGLFLPGRIAIPFLIYIVFWGFSTTIARIFANFYSELWQYSLSRWAHETLFRFPHFLIPLLLLIWIWREYVNRPMARSLSGC